MYDYIVVGMGMIGSAALRYLSTASKNVAGIGPDEPVDYRNHNGVFASYYDQARITRILDMDIVWATLAKRSIARYREIEKQSGINFYSEAGCLRLVSTTEDMDKVRAVGDALQVRYEELDADVLKKKFPLQYPDGEIYVKIGGGIVDSSMESLEDFQKFFHTDGSPDTAKRFREILESLLPGMHPQSYTTAPCVVATTPTDHPYIDTIVPSQIFVAAVGCGAAAKSSDEIGRLGALLTQNERWQDELKSSHFTVRYKE